jgi:hypothetical protein
VIIGVKHGGTNKMTLRPAAAPLEQAHAAPPSYTAPPPAYPGNAPVVAMAVAVPQK